MESRLTCHEFKPSAAKDPSSRMDLCTLNLLRLNGLTDGVVWKLIVPAQVPSSSLDHDSKLRKNPESPNFAKNGQQHGHQITKNDVKLGPIAKISPL
ncbi:hypothetical protein TNCV_1917001 [Trichonephila clavipes]|uniref:Uncharacterized protein n=1 Tax=Trichonephila clavipes TaxID=2585209 RepID=A0A8X7BBJ5_TRICX|nr:hypothetical protein TNCV_1917001 [Trichonephila clavipes]